MPPVDAVTRFFTDPSNLTFVAAVLAVVVVIFAANNRGVWGWGRVHRDEIEALKRAHKEETEGLRSQLREAKAARKEEVEGLRAQIREAKEAQNDQRDETQRWQTIAVRALSQFDKAADKAVQAVQIATNGNGDGYSLLPTPPPKRRVRKPPNPTAN